MQVKDWLESWLLRWKNDRRRRTRRSTSQFKAALDQSRSPAGIERLEPRTLPAVITVTSLADNLTVDGQVTLREAIQAANTDKAVDGSTKGQGADSIQFAPSLTAGGPATITLNGMELEINSSLTINGPGANRLTINADNRSGIFIVDNHQANLSDVTISGLTLTAGNRSYGGAVVNHERLTVSACDLVGNSALSGGAISNEQGNLTVSDSSISGNSAVAGLGGGIGSNNQATLTVLRSTIANNSASGGSGGGIASLNSSTLTLRESSITGNSVANGGGGGIVSYDGVGELLIDRCTISGNSTNNGSGGGLEAAGPGDRSQTLTITQSTISGNFSTRYGGGIAASTFSELQITQSTIVGNISEIQGGGLFGFDTIQSTLANSIVAGNSSDFGGTIVWSSNTKNNLIGDPNHAAGLTNGSDGNIVGQSNGAGARVAIALATVLEPMLANNGGPTLTHALVSGSPAINAGDDSSIPADRMDLDGDGNVTEAVPFDQRGNGFQRVMGGNSDIGAIEFGTDAPEPDDGALPTVSVSVVPGFVAEDDSDEISFLLTRDVTTGPLTVNLKLGGTATAESDYSASTIDSVTFADGESTATVNITPVADSHYEADESVVLQVASGSGYQTGSTKAASGLILNDESLFWISDGLSVKPEGDSGTTLLTFSVNRDGSRSRSASVDFAVVGSGAKPADAADFGGTLPSGTLHFPPNDTGQAITIEVSGDTTFEPNETFKVVLSNAIGGDVGSMFSAPGTILNDDTALSITATSTSKAEGNDGSTPFTFKVTRAGNTSGTASVNYAVTGNGPTAADSSDFGGTLPNGEITFSAGEVTKTITLNVSGDTSIEQNEGFLVTLSNVVGAGLGTATASGTIVNDDASLSIEATDSAKPEGHPGSTPFTFTVTRTGNSAVTANVAYVVSGRGANPADAADFGDAFPSGTVSFTAGETAKTLTVSVSGDSLQERNEGFLVTLSNPSVGNTLVTSTALGTIFNDDASLSITATNAALSEGQSGTVPFTFTVDRTGNTSSPSTVAYAVSGRGANPTDVADFGGSFPSGTVSFSAGETSKTLTVLVGGDTAAEKNEGFLVSLSNPSAGNTLVTSTAMGTIVNDDTSLSITSTDTAKSEKHTGTTPFTFTVARTGVTTGSSSVSYAVTGRGANPTNAADFGGSFPSGTVSFSTGENSKTLTVLVSGDTTVEKNEGFLVTLSNPSAGSTLVTSTAMGTIVNDDASLSITATDAAKSEGHSGTKPFTFTVSRTGDLTGSSSVSYAVTGRGANPTNAADFGSSFPSGTVSFAAGENSKTLTVLVSGDTAIEKNEGFLVTLSNPSVGSTLVTTTSLGTIVNDDASLSITASAADKSEGQTGTVAFTFSVARAGDTSSSATVAYVVSGRGANPTDAADFGGFFPTGTVSFAAGEALKTFTVLASGDTTKERNEGFLVTLSNPSVGSTLVIATALGTIINDDA